MGFVAGGPIGKADDSELGYKVSYWTSPGLEPYCRLFMGSIVIWRAVISLSLVSPYFPDRRRLGPRLTLLHRYQGLPFAIAGLSSQQPGQASAPPTTALSCLPCSVFCSAYGNPTLNLS
jgi:hypothetical protein